jgi:hypothetical protein
MQMNALGACSWNSPSAQAVTTAAFFMPFRLPSYLQHMYTLPPADTLQVYRLNGKLMVSQLYLFEKRNLC